jgi:hypothetical protein
MSKNNNKIRINEDDIKKIVDEKISSYIKPIKYFLYGLVAFFIIGFGSELILPKNLIRIIHDGIFGEEKFLINKIDKGLQSEVGISYHRSFMLYSQNQRSERMLFFAEKGQKVKVYVETSHYGTSLEKRKLIVELDHQILWDGVEDFKGGFNDITDNVFNQKNTIPYKEENVYSLEFSLDDSQPQNLNDKVFVDCVIIVFGKLSNVEKK